MLNNASNSFYRKSVKKMLVQPFCNILKPYVPLSIKRMSECVCNILKEGEFLISSDSEFMVFLLYTQKWLNYLQGQSFTWEGCNLLIFRLLQLWKSDLLVNKLCECKGSGRFIHLMYWSMIGNKVSCFNVGVICWLSFVQSQRIRTSTFWGSCSLPMLS